MIIVAIMYLTIVFLATILLLYYETLQDYDQLRTYVPIKCHMFCLVLIR